MIKITVKASSAYDILIGKGLLDKCGEIISELTKSKKCAVVTDTTVDGLYGSKILDALKKSGFNAVKFAVPAGEESKSHQQLIGLYNFLSENDITRSDFLIALGGGVVGDLTGYCAATYLRGVDYVQIPTTLLAQVDSSVGGKTAVNIDAGKNLVGCFKQPIAVVADTDTLSTLSEDIFADGMGEVVKYGMIRSSSLFEKLSHGRTKENIGEIIAECVGIKSDVVENDELDTGERMILNFGHTFGHAIEKYMGYGVVPHGKAVAMGMYMISRAAENRSLTQKGVSEKLKACLKANFLPFFSDIDRDSLYSLSIGDKKRTSDKIRVIVCPEIGKSEIVTLSLNEYKNLLELI